MLRLHQRAPKTRELPGPLRGPWTPAERTLRFARKNIFFHLKICFFKLNNTFLESDRLEALDLVVMWELRGLSCCYGVYLAVAGSTSRSFSQKLPCVALSRRLYMRV